MRALCLAIAILFASCNSVEDFFSDDDKKTLPKIPPREKCAEHLSECLGTRLQSVRGGSAGHSRCKDCHLFCDGQKRWPDELPGGKDCRWWNHQ